jgi:hypothetical protein
MRPGVIAEAISAFHRFIHGGNSTTVNDAEAGIVVVEAFVSADARKRRVRSIDPDRAHADKQEGRR